jgi:hypothetical protein
MTPNSPTTRIWRRRGLCLAAAASLLAGLPLAATPDFAASPLLTRYPYLTDMTSTGVSVNFATDTQAPRPVVTWGPSGSSCQASTATVSVHKFTVAGAPEYQFSAPIAGLTPHTGYCYRVVQAGVDLLGSDPSPAFTTFVPAGASTSFSFAVLGDWGMVDASGGNPDLAMVLSHVAGSGASFVTTVGDNAYWAGSQTNYGDLQHTGPQTSDVFGPRFWKQVGKGTPAFLAMGNHGMDGGTAAPQASSSMLVDWPQAATVAASGGRYELDSYCCVDGTTRNNHPSAWYAFDYGQARFYVLETAWSDYQGARSSIYQVDHDYHWTPSSLEYKWLKADLAAHAGTPLKFAFFHFPLHSDSIAAAPSDTFLAGQGQLEGLLSSNGVAVAFTGHAHLYERNLPVVGSMPSYITGGGGGPPVPVQGCSPFDAYAVGFNGSTGYASSCRAPVPASPSQVFEFLLVRVTGTSVTVIPTDETGRTFDVQTYQR